MGKTKVFDSGLRNITIDGKPANDWLRSKENDEKSDGIRKILSQDFISKRQQIRKHSGVGRYADDESKPETHYLTGRQVEKEYGMDTRGMSVVEKVLTRLVAVGDEGITVNKFMDDFPTIGKSKISSVRGVFSRAVKYLPKVVGVKSEDSATKGSSKNRKQNRYFLTAPVTAEKLIAEYRKKHNEWQKSVKEKRKAKKSADTVSNQEPSNSESVEDIVKKVVGEMYPMFNSGIVDSDIGVEQSRLRSIVGEINNYVGAINKLVDEGKKYGLWVAFGDDGEGQLLTVNCFQNIR